MSKQELIEKSIVEFLESEGVKKYTLQLQSLLRANLEPVMLRLWHDAFVKGYERGKSDEKDAKEIDKSLGL